MKIRAKGTKGVIARATQEGKIILSIRGSSKTENFAFAAHDVPEIVARLIAAHAASSQKEGRLPHAIVAQMTVVAIDGRAKRVTLSLMPTENLHIPFSMTPALASKTADSLAEAVATLEPPSSRKPH